MKSLVFLISSLFIFTSCVTTTTKEVDGFAIEEQTEKTKRIEKSDLYLSMGQNFEDHGKITQATESYQKSLEYYPENHKTHFILGKLLLNRGFASEGLKSIQKAIEINPSFTKAYNYLAYYYYKRGKKKIAYQYILESSKDLVYENQEQTWALKFNLERQLKKYDELWDTFYKAYSTLPRDCALRSMIAHNLAVLNKKELALSALNQAKGLCRKPDDLARLSFIKSIVYYKNGDYAVAKDILEGLNPRDNKLKKRVPKLLMSLEKKMEKLY